MADANNLKLTDMQLIDGKATAAEIKKEIRAKVDAMVAEGKRAPHLAAILVGHDGGSETYVASKVKAARLSSASRMTSTSKHCSTP